MIPQFSESFLDRLVEMSTQNNDIEYRQELTDRIIRESLAVTVLDKEQGYYEDLNRRCGSWVANGSSGAARQAAIERSTSVSAPRWTKCSCRWTASGRSTRKSRD